jgi:hypothetical protein
VEEDPGQQEAIVDMIVAAKAPAPQENGIHGAAAVEDYGQQKAGSSIVPGHGVRVIDKV